MTLRAIPALVLAGIGFGLLHDAPARAVGATFVVDITADEADDSPGDAVCETSGGGCSLRAAVQEANALAGADTITLPAGIYTFALNGPNEDAAATGDLDITESLTITGAGPGSTIVQAGDGITPATDRVFDVVAGTVDISGVTVRYGIVPTDGGGIRQRIGTTLSLTTANVTLNRASVYHSGTKGGGIATDGVLVLRDSTISLNYSGDWAAGIWAGGDYAWTSYLDLENVTISGNFSDCQSAAIGGVANGTLNNVTIARNTTACSVGAVRVQNVSYTYNTLAMRNTIIADNTSTYPPYADCYIITFGYGPASTSNGHNLGPAGCGFNQPTDQLTAAGGTLALASNGGPTMTNGLLGTSLAIDHGDATTCPALDQRGFARLGACDIGAFEYNGVPSDGLAPTSTVALSPGSPGGSGWFTTSVQVTVTAADDAGGSGVAETRCVLDPAVAPTTFAAIPTGCPFTGGADVTADGHHTVYAASVDALGNAEAPVSATFDIDRTKPVITPAAGSYVSGTWTNQDVTVSFSCSDGGGSGVSPGSSVTGATLSADGADQSVTNGGSCTDNAGNVADAATFANIDIDKTEPLITPNAGSYVAGNWTNQNVTVSFSCSDVGGSGVAAGSSVTGATVSSEGADQSVTNGGSCTDNAGNVADAATFANIDIDKTAPVLTVSSVAVPSATGFYPAQTFLAVPATVGAGPVNLAGTASDARSGLAAVTVNGGSPSATSPWNKTGVILATDGSTATVTATDQAGNSSSVLAATLNLDLDGDGIANSIDGNSTVGTGVAEYATASARFSDKKSGGSTSGRLSKPFPGTITGVQVRDLTTGGVSVVVAGSGGKASLTLDGKAGTIKLSPGQYVITDPPTITVGVTAGGSAEIDYVVNGETVTVVVPDGSTADITETLANGALVGLTVLQTGGTVPVTLDGTPVGSASLAAKLGVSSTRFTLNATLTLSGSALITLPERVDLAIGGYSATIPASSLRLLKKGQYAYGGTVHGVSLNLLLTRLSATKYQVQLTGSGPNGVGPNPVTVGVTIGNDSGVQVVKASGI
jgi:CSLREA domain-containing protein